MSELPGAPSLAETESRLSRQLTLAKTASRRLAHLPGSAKRTALETMADSLEAAGPAIVEASRLDFEEAERAGLAPGILDRLHLDRRGLAAMADSIRRIAGLPDPVGGIEEVRRLPTGLEVTTVRVPLGVVAVLYESRPHLAADAAALALKAGNAVVLQVGREAPATARAVSGALGDAGLAAGLPMGFLVTLGEEPTNLSLLLTAEELVDVVVCRGSQEFSQRMVQAATVPIIWHGPGICHVYVEKSAELEQAARIVANAKLGRAASTNSIKGLVLDRAVARDFLARVSGPLEAEGIRFRGEAEVAGILAEVGATCEPAKADDLGDFHGELALSVALVEGVGEAMAHIERFGTGHSEAICTRDWTVARQFQDGVDAACVYVNASTRLTDGAELGLGVDLAVSTSKLPVRGPVTARSLTSTKFVVSGDGQIRGRDILAPHVEG